MKNRPILSLSSFKKNKDATGDKTKTTENESVNEQKILPNTQGAKPQKEDTPKKAPPAQKQIRISDEDFDSVYNYFNTHYPLCFSANTPPLAVGIRKQIRAIEDLPFPQDQISRFLARYTKNIKYRRQIIAGTNRINLDGSIHSQVLEKHEFYVKKFL